MKRAAFNDDERVTPNKCVVINNNAFSVLMSGGSSSCSSGNARNRNASRRIVRSKKGLSTASKVRSRFVPCPAGCGKHILPHEVNAHLDRCMIPEHIKNPSPQSRPSAENTEGKLLPDTTTAEPAFERIRKTDHKRILNDEVGTTETRTGGGTNDILSRMMKRATEVFAEGGSGTSSFSAGGHKQVQRMHLHTDGSVTLTCYGSPPNDKLALRGQPEPIAWSATVQVKNGQPVPVELIVSSSIPPAPDGGQVEGPSLKSRLVQRHSRLSVPVLKSILQKSIRRRKPLPSVRVAMELADKSLGDLLRRLPVIVVEDSTLHSDLPLLVWLMIAASKDYDIPLKLMKRILEIIFEVASCRWKDDIAPKNASARTVAAALEMTEATPQDGRLPPFSISCLHKAGTIRADNRLSSVDLLVWSLLMRSHYGGMAGDIRMLRGYAETWHTRFHVESHLPEDMVKRLTLASDNAPNLVELSVTEWSQVPTYIHKSAAAQSPCKIDSMFVSSASQFRHPQHHSAYGLPCLFAADLTCEGVDFHCSSVLETSVLSDIDFLRECYDLLEKMTLPSSVTPFPTAEVPTSASSYVVKDVFVRRRCWLESLLKTLMWNHSAGVNLRLPLVPHDHDGSHSPVTTDPQAKLSLKVFWETKIRPRTKAFSERYIQERIARG
jgi:hypothetical protein